MSTPLPEFVTEWFDFMDENPSEMCKDQLALRELVTQTFENEELIIDIDLYHHYVGLGKYLGFGDGFEWERYCLGCFLCVFRKDNGLPRWDEGFFFMGRGAGKDGFISWLSLCLISPYNKIPNYDIDICAYNEDQALRPVEDVYNAMESQEKLMKKFFYWTKEKILGKKNGGYIKGHTNNALGKDGLRSGAVFLNEIHTYQNYDNINVFTTGLGKKDHPRTGYFTTNGDIVGGPLDDKLTDAENVLFHSEPDEGVFYFICRLDDKSEVDNELMWRKANPSLRYKPSLLNEMKKEYRKWKKNPNSLTAFMTKRMNLRQTAIATPAAEWDDIAATNMQMPNLDGFQCVVGIDFAKINDWAAVNFHFVVGETRYDINHAFVCLQSKELYRIKAPFREWANLGHVTLVDEVEINPELIAGYIKEQMELHRWHVRAIGIDNFRYALLKKALEEIQFSDKRKNIKLIRPSDIMRVVPVITRLFTNGLFIWGDQPCLRWATNNTKMVPAKRSKLVVSGELDMGNFLYDKIEPHARKTDPFMSLVNCVCLEDMLSGAVPVRKRVRAQVYN